MITYPSSQVHPVLIVALRAGRVVRLVRGTDHGHTAARLRLAGWNVHRACATTTYGHKCSECGRPTEAAVRLEETL